MRPSPPAASPATSAVGGEALPGLPASGSLASAGTGRLPPSAGSADSGMSGYQPEGGGAIPTSALQPKQLRIERVPRHIARGIIVENHYLHRMGIAHYAFGVFGPQREIVGAITFGPLASREAEGSLGAGASVMELTRLWLADSCGPNSESRVIRVAIRLLRKARPDVTLVVAYSDPSVGHDGTIYRAAGFEYVGLGPQRYDFVPQSWAGRAFSRTRSSSTALKTKHGLDALGIPYKRIIRQQKHRYILRLAQEVLL